MEKKEKKEKKKIIEVIKEMGIEKIVFVLLIGILLLVLSFPSGKKENKENPDSTVAKTVSSQSSYENLLEDRLRQTLKTVQGVGEVDVMITLKASEQKILDKDVSIQNNQTNEIDSQGGSREVKGYTEDNKSVLVGGGSGSGEPYVVQERMPEIEGVLVVAQGGDNASIKSEIYAAIEALFDVPAHKIKVLKRAF